MRIEPNALIYGDNLPVLRQYIPDESVDLVYLDPPFNSNANYNVLFKDKSGTDAAAQIEAFGDTWHWDQAAAATFHDVLRRGGPAAEALLAFEKLLGHNDMLAYLAMMAARLVELRRVLKPTGSIYLHCDPTASHYLKVLMDAVFGVDAFLSEVIWKRTGTHSSARRWGPVHDVILSYARRAGSHVWNRQYEPLAADHRRRHYSHVDSDGRRYAHGELTAPGTRNGRSGATWRGFDVTAMGRHWSTTVERLEEMAAEGRIYFPPDGGWPRLIRYEEEGQGRAVGDIWDTIPPINMMAKERLGYPTQKPLPLLERIISASSNPGDVVLDPFCGCGTTVHAAQKLDRRWIGIDITHLAIGLMRKRLTDAFGDAVQFTVHGEPKTEQDAAELARTDEYQFQWWALSLVGASPGDRKKGADKGIDGKLFFVDGPKEETRTVILSVKAGQQIHRNIVHELGGVVTREGAAIGVLITMKPPTKPMREEAASAGYYESPWGTSHPRLQILTVGELLDGRRIDMPAPRHTNVTHERAPRERGGGAAQGRLGL